MYQYLLEKIDDVMTIHVNSEAIIDQPSKVENHKYTVELIPEGPPLLIPSIKFTLHDRHETLTLVDMARISSDIVSYLTRNALEAYDLLGIRLDWLMDSQSLLITFEEYQIKSG